MPRRRLTLRSTAHTSAAEIDLPSSPDCAFLRDPLGLSQLSVTVSLAPLREEKRRPRRIQPKDFAHDRNPRR